MCTTYLYLRLWQYNKSPFLFFQFDWMKLKINFQPLNEAQLYHLVCGYDHGGKQPPSSWLPSPEDRHQANMKGISKIVMYIVEHRKRSLHMTNMFISDTWFIIFYLGKNVWDDSCLTPISAVFELYIYCCSLFCWLWKRQYSENHIDPRMSLIKFIT